MMTDLKTCWKSLAVGLLVLGLAHSPVLAQTETPTWTDTTSPETPAPSPTDTWRNETFTPTPTPTFTQTWTPSATATSTRTMTVTPTRTGCDKSLLGLGPLPANPVAAGTTVVGFIFASHGGCSNSETSIGFSTVVTGNLRTEIQQAQLWNEVGLVSTIPYDPSGFLLPGIHGYTNTIYEVRYVLSEYAEGSVQTSLTSYGGFNSWGYYLPMTGTFLTVVNNGTPTPTPMPLGTETPTPLPTVRPDLCLYRNVVYGDEGTLTDQLTADGTGAVYSVGRNLSGVFRVLKFDLDYKILWEYLNDSVPHYNQAFPSALAVDSAGSVRGVGSEGVFGATINLVRLDPTGTAMWNLSYPATLAGASYKANDIALDPAGNAYIVGSRTGPLSNDNYSLLLKVGPGGNILWSREYDLEPGLGTEEGVRVTIGPGGVYWVGRHFNSPYLRVLRCDVDGNVIWSKDPTGPTVIPQPRGLSVDGSGAIYVDGLTLTGTFGILKFDGMGNQLWQNQYTSGLGENPGRITLGPDGDLYASCMFGQGMDGVLRFGPTGILDWAFSSPILNTYPVTHQPSLIFDPGGRIVLSSYHFNLDGLLGRIVVFDPNCGPTPTSSPTPVGYWTTPTVTCTPIWTRTPTPTLSATPVISATPTFSLTVTESYSITGTPTLTHTTTPSETPTRTFTLTSTATATCSFTSTATPSSTRSATSTWTMTETPSNTLTVTFTPTFTDSPTPSATISFSDTLTPPPMDTPTETPAPGGPLPLVAMNAPAVVQALAYPNPSRTGATNLYYNVTGQAVAISALGIAPVGSEDPTAQVRLKVFTASGLKVWEADLSGVKEGGNSYSWNGRDLTGTPLSNGLYFYRAEVQGSGNTLSSKLSPILILR